MKTLVSLSALILGASLGSTPATAAIIDRVGDDIVLSGPIVQGDSNRFEDAIDTDVKRVMLRSSGGIVEEAIAIGRSIRRRHLETTIPANAVCQSACALLWVAGRPRTVAGQLAVHCPITPGTWQCQADGRARMIAYLKEMDAPAGVVAMQEAAGSTSSIFLTAAQLAEPAPVADGRPEDEDLPPPPRRRPPPPVYGPPPGWIFIPSEQRAMPCLPTLLTAGLLRFCI
jgi:hypothetical protein